MYKKAKGLTVRVGGIRAIVAAAGIAAIALTGCNEDTPEASTVDEPTRSATTNPEPTEEPTPDEPTDPETTEPTEDPTANGDGPTTRGSMDEVAPDVAADAEAFISDFMAAYDEAAGTGEFSSVEELYSDSCEECDKNVSAFVSVYEDGGRVEGGGFTEPVFSVVGGMDDAVVIQVESTIAPFEVLDADGTVVESSPAQPSKDTFHVQEDAGGAWQVVAWIA